jgi:hypothetical protein
MQVRLLLLLVVLLLLLLCPRHSPAAASAVTYEAVSWLQQPLLCLTQHKRPKIIDDILLMPTICWGCCC